MPHLVYFKRRNIFCLNITLFYLGGVFFLIYFQPVLLIVIFLVIFMLIGLDFLIREWKTMYLTYSGIPALELTKDHYMDNCLMVKIQWTDIVDIKVKHMGKGYYGIQYEFKNDNVLYVQLQRPYSRWMYLLVGATVYSQLHLVRVKADRDELFERMKDYHKKAIHTL